MTGLTVKVPSTELTLAPRERSHRELVMTAPTGAAGPGAHELTVRVERRAGPPIVLTSHFFVPDRR